MDFPDPGNKQHRQVYSGALGGKKLGVRQGSPLTIQGGLEEVMSPFCWLLDLQEVRTIKGFGDTVVQWSLTGNLEVVLVGCKGPIVVTRDSHSSVARTCLSAATPAATGW